MNATTATKVSVSISNTDIGKFVGEIVSFNTGLKLYHWNVTGAGSYAQHIALDEGLAELTDATDRLVETTIAMKGDLSIVVPATSIPVDIVKHVEAFYHHSEAQRGLFSEAFTQAIIDDYQEALQQMLYRLKRLQ